jgi:hypothetical protein
MPNVGDPLLKDLILECMSYVALATNVRDELLWRQTTLILSRRPSMPEEDIVTWTTERPTLAKLFSEIVDQLSRIQNGKCSVECPDPTVAIWGDDAYLYLEAELSRYISLEADVSIHQGRVFIRMEA